MPSGETAAPPAPDSRAERLNTRAAGVVGLAVLCSRVLGLAREQIFAALFGGGRAPGAFTNALSAPHPPPGPFGGSAPSPAFATGVTPPTAPEGDAPAPARANH